MTETNPNLKSVQLTVPLQTPAGHTLTELQLVRPRARHYMQVDHIARGLGWKLALLAQVTGHDLDLLLDLDATTDMGAALEALDAFFPDPPTAEPEPSPAAAGPNQEAGAWSS